LLFLQLPCRRWCLWWCRWRRWWWRWFWHEFEFSVTIFIKKATNKSTIITVSLTLWLISSMPASYRSLTNLMFFEGRLRLLFALDNFLFVFLQATVPFLLMSCLSSVCFSHNKIPEL
jgi:hypothetical protein